MGITLITIEYDRETIMARWDSWRRYIKDGGGGTWPRDEFEALLDYFEEQLELKTDEETTGYERMHPM